MEYRTRRTDRSGVNDAGARQRPAVTREAAGAILIGVPFPPRLARLIVDRLWPADGPGSFRVWGVPGVPREPWWPEPDDDPREIERAARHPHWDDRPRERRALLDEAQRLRRAGANS
jgi:hypothetical protein